MRGQDSLIEQFYNATEKHRAQWADLFDHVGWWLYAIAKHSWTPKSETES